MAHLGEFKRLNGQTTLCVAVFALKTYSMIIVILITVAILTLIQMGISTLSIFILSVLFVLALSPIILGDFVVNKIFGWMDNYPRLKRFLGL